MEPRRIEVLYAEFERVFTQERQRRVLNNILTELNQDQGLYRLNGNYRQVLRENGMLEDFERICQDNGIDWQSNIHP